MATFGQSPVSAAQRFPGRRPGRIRPVSARPRIQELSGSASRVSPSSQHLGPTSRARGAGHGKLIEIPSDHEAHDNVLTFWVPATPVRAGQPFEMSYRLHW
ncbi:MAG: glucan biosynthesis protein [Rhizobiales bacterium]|nr:glucan biosynthesis protein [Hyphomicrobiales bacterium]